MKSCKYKAIKFLKSREEAEIDSAIKLFTPSPEKAANGVKNSTVLSMSLDAFAKDVEHSVIENSNSKVFLVLVIL